MAPSYICDVGRRDVLRAGLYAGGLVALALQLLFLKASESMGNHDSEIVDAGSVD